MVINLILEYKNIDAKYKTIRAVLKNEFNLSQNLIVKLKKANCIFLNNISSFIDKEIKPDDIIKVVINFDEVSDNIVPTKMSLDIVYEDDFYLIINKPAGIPVHPSFMYFDNTISNGVKYYFNSICLKRKLRPVNRLDKNTSGLVVFAKNEYIQECLITQMKNNIFTKEYLAILDGSLENNCGTINAPIARKSDSIIEREISNLGQNSITHYKVLKIFTKYSLVHFTLETGRTHQIRVHSKYINHPILGDSLYGKSSDLISRQALHAYKISFIHPIYKNSVSYIANIPDDILKLLEEVNK